jgi:hypothetical protein
MRNKARVFFESTLLVSLIAGSLTPLASGSSTSVAVSFGGAVNPPLPGITLPTNVLQGDALSGSFSYNPGQLGTLGVYNFTNSTPSASLLFVITTPGFTPSQFSDLYVAGAGKTYTITITDAKSGPGATLDIHALTAGSTINKPNAFIDVILTSKTYTGKLALPTATGATPTTTDISSFLTSPGLLKWDPDGVGLEATLTNFNGFNVQSIPEPSSQVLASLATTICAVGVVFNRRKNPTRGQNGCLVPSPRH